MKAKIIIILCTLICLNLKAQTETIKKDLILFLLKSKDLTGNISDYSNNVLIVNDIITLESFDNTQFGVFKFGSLSSHTYFHLILKNSFSYSIVDMRQPLDSIIVQVIDYFNPKKSYDKITTLKYLSEVIALHKRNLNAIPWKED